jgi:hypothetical protein
VQIPATDTAGGQSGGDTTTALNKGKGKVMRVITSNDEVSFDDDAPWQRQLRLIRNTVFLVGGPMSVEPQVLEVTVLGGSSGSTPAVVFTVMEEKVDVDKEVTDAIMAKKVADDVMVVSMKATTDKEAADAAVK